MRAARINQSIHNSVFSFFPHYFTAAGLLFIVRTDAAIRGCVDISDENFVLGFVLLAFPFLLAPPATVADSNASAVDDVVDRVDLGDDDGGNMLLHNIDARSGPRYRDKNFRNTRLWEND